MTVTNLIKNTTLLLLGAGLIVGLGAQAFVREARAQKPGVEKSAGAEKPAKTEKPGGANAKTEKPAVGESVHATVKSVDEKANSLVVIIPGIKGTKEATEETFSLATDTAIVLVHGLKKNETKPGKIGDLTPGAPVTIQLTVDKKAVAQIHVHGGSASGVLKSIDASKNMVTLSSKNKTGPVETTFELEKDGKVYLDDGFGKKNEPQKEGKFTDLSEGTMINAQLSGYDRSKAVSIHASGPSVHGSVVGVDIGNNTITIKSKGEGEQTYSLHKDVRFKGKLADIVAGTGASLRLSIEDKKTVVEIGVKE